MSQISVSNLTFAYEESYDFVFENVSFSIDSDWKLGLIGRNGRGKTTFLNLLQNKYSYSGTIHTSIEFEYFPYEIQKKEEEKITIDLIETLAPDYELWKICRELEYLKVDMEVLYRQFNTLSNGEQTKVLLALLFSKEGIFLLIDEPTNHLERSSRVVVQEYLCSKKGFILVSHDRALLDACIDHVLVINRESIEVQKGNFSSWWENKKKQELYEQVQNEKLKREIGKLQESARRTAQWADNVEAKKIGYDPRKEHDRFIGTRSFMAEKSRRMQQRRKNLEKRQKMAIKEKSKLLKNLEEIPDLKIEPLLHHKERYISFRQVGLQYGDKNVCDEVSFELRQGDRVVLEGKNGCGKSSIIKAILMNNCVEVLNCPAETVLKNNFVVSGEINIPKGLKISYINQDTSFLKGSLTNYIEKVGLDESLFKAVLRQMDFERVQFEKSMEEYSEGQRKKVLITSSILQQAHLYIWDEPLNYIDVFSRMQIESLIKTYQPTLLLVEHDQKFCDDIATKTVKVSKYRGR